MCVYVDITSLGPNIMEYIKARPNSIKPLDFRVAANSPSDGHNLKSHDVETRTYLSFIVYEASIKLTSYHGAEFQDIKL